MGLEGLLLGSDTGALSCSSQDMAVVGWDGSEAFCLFACFCFSV